MLRCLLYFLSYMLVAAFVIFMAGIRYFPQHVERIVGINIAKPEPDETEIADMTIAPKDGQYERPIRQLVQADWKNLEQTKSYFSLTLDCVVLSESDLIRIGRIINLRNIRFQKCFLLSDLAHAALDEYWSELEDSFRQDEGCFFDNPICSKSATDLLIRMQQVDHIELETIFFPVDQEHFARSQRLYQLIME